MFVSSPESYDHLSRMTEQPPTPPPDSVREHAVHWFVRLHSGLATDDDRRAFDAWLAIRQDHRREFEQISRMWTTLDDTQPLLEAEIAKAEDLWKRHDSAPGTTSTWSWWSVRQTAAVGAALSLVLLTTWWWTGLPDTIRYETAKGAQQQVRLADGSTVLLNTDTQLTVQISRSERIITLDRGEAWFTVEHERRPFTVQAGNGSIRDIGTQFLVNKAADAVNVSVWEGSVEVGIRPTGESSSAAAPVILQAGQQTSYGTDGSIAHASAFDRDSLGSWREGTLIFRSQALERVLAEVARYRSEEIRLLHPALASIPVSGVFHIRDLDRFIQTLQDSLPVRAHRVHGTLIVIEPAPVSSNPSVLSHR
ncbi:FecR family protein [Nitrospira japonica]|uniref:FecR family protein n=1 Tax=Nitrospira japonica TaxID=1325564 RepID=UPI0012DC868D|nr:FecR family protein [Nitrospira japonica]